MALVFTDKGDSVWAYVASHIQGVTWGPAVDNGEWFVSIAGAEAFRVPSKEAAIAALRESIEKAGA